MSITIIGNRHIDAAMIRAQFHAGAGGRLDAAALDAALKSLYATRLFRDVKISRDGDNVVVTVVENPSIAKVAFEGNKKIKDGDLKKAVQSAEGGPLSRALVHDDVERLIELYRQQGYFEVQIAPKMIKAKNDRVSLVFEIKEGEKLAVRQVEFAGNVAYPASKLKSVVKTGESNALSFLTDNDIYDADRVENDRDLIRRFYLAHGYADVRVRAAAAYQPDRKGVIVTFTIDEGRQYRFGKVDLESNLKSVDAAPLRSYLRTNPGEIYDADAVQKTVEDLTLGLAKNGAPFAAILAHSERAPQSSSINLVYTVDEGKRLYIERIQISGNSKTRDDVIRREFDFGEGDAYNRALLDRG
ncbi:MAG TPA: outer membrane protein assembly factor BamA, partial [Xanthobacteraceae bacterium]|nr:outer membrane protein assembly factor BamA [Xanthobacteraceae bacterium]